MKNIRVASVQFQHAPGDKPANLHTIQAFVEQAAAQHVALIAFPEMCITGYWHVRNLSRDAVDSLAESVPSGPSSQLLLALAAQHGMTIGAGLIERAENGTLRNSYVVAMPDGHTAYHRKLQAFEDPYMQSGDAYTVFDTPHGCRVGVLICYDNNIIENARITALMGAEILLALHQTGGCRSRSPRAMGAIDPALWDRRKEDPAAAQYAPHLLQHPVELLFVAGEVEHRAAEHGVHGVILERKRVHRSHAEVVGRNVRREP